MNKKELVLTRVFNAPRERVWKAWTDPKLMAQWWGPKGFTNPLCQLDLRVGGAIRVDMRWPDGRISKMGGAFREIKEPERLVFTSTAFEGDEGNPDLENLNTVTFEEENGKTKATLHVVVIKATPAMAEALAGMETGWSMSFDKLTEFLEKH